MTKDFHETITATLNKNDAAPELMFSAAGMKMWNVSPNGISFTDSQHELFEAASHMCGFAAITFEEQDSHSEVVSTVSKTASLVNSWNLLSSVYKKTITHGAAFFAFWAGVIYFTLQGSGFGFIFLLPLIITVISYFHALGGTEEEKEAVQMKELVEKIEKEEAEADAAFAQNPEFFVVSQFVAHTMMDILNIVENKAMMVSLFRQKMEFDNNHSSVKEWMGAVKTMFVEDKNFPVDAVPLLNKETHIVRRELHLKVIELAWIEKQNQIRLEAIKAAEAEQAKMEKLIPELEAKEVLKRYAVEDSSRATQRAQDYMNSL